MTMPAACTDNMCLHSCFYHIQYFSTPPPISSRVATFSSEGFLAVQGLPLDAESIAAGIVADAVHTGDVSIKLAGERLGPICALLIQDMIKVRTLPGRCDVYDDVSTATVRELCLNFYDAR